MLCSVNEQLSLFDNPTMSKEEFAEKVIAELNKIDTVWKGQFYLNKLLLEYWDHVKTKYKVLEVHIKARNWREDSTFIQFKGDRQSQYNLYNAVVLSEWLSEISKDKDFSFSITPWNIYVFYHNWELKKIT